MNYGRILRLLGVSLTAAMATLAAVAIMLTGLRPIAGDSASAVGPVDLTGTWSISFVDQLGNVGACTAVVTQAGSTLSGSITCPAGLGTLLGEVTDSTVVSLSTTFPFSYEVDWQGEIISPNKLSGTWSDNLGSSGTFQATRTSATPTPKPTPTPTPAKGPAPEGDVSGIYKFLITLTPAGEDPGAYFHCRSDIQQVDKDLTARVYCYTDIPGVAVNAYAGPESGDGLPGTPPPPPYAQVGTEHTVLTGSLDNDDSEIRLSGCFEEDPYEVNALGNVYWDLVLDAQNPQGTVDIWINQTTANCLDGTPAGTPDYDDAVVKYGWLAPKGDQYDTDGDGCPDKNELSDDERAGGLRDPYNKWDYFNPTNDGQNRIDDVLEVIANYRQDDPPATNKYDRSWVAGSNDWNLGPPNGTIRIADILAAIFQFRHDCGDGEVWPPKPTPWE